MVNKSVYINGLSTYEVQGELLFSSNCALIQFEIVSIWNTSRGSAMTLANIQNFIDFDTSTGLLTFKKFNEILDIFIKLKAFDGLTWTSSTVIPQVRLVVQEVPVSYFEFEIVNEIEPTNQTTQLIEPYFESNPDCPPLEIDLSTSS